MPWYDVITGRGAAPPPASPEAAALTAAAVPAAAPQAQYIRVTDRWQNEAWTYYETLGEFRYGVNWLANMISRVRLRAGELDPASDEPSIVDDGLAAQAMSEFGNGIGGRADIMRRLAIQLSVPGECYTIGEQRGPVSTWQVRSVAEVRAQGGTYQVTDENTVNTGAKWRDLAKDSIPVRIWRPGDRFYHLADSPARAALDVMRELELVNRAIRAQYLSRLASSGMIVLPEEMTFPVREEFADAEDPITMEWVEIAATAIATPGTARAAVPIPLMVPAELVDKIKFIDFTVTLDEKILDRRDQAIRRLATILDIPSDVMLGLGDTNHWSAWAVEESGLKAHIAPLVEQICAALTTGYLQPRLAASDDPNAMKYVVWYDMSELTLRPDTSQNAKDAYDRMEISGDALRTATGFSPDDKPSPEELKAIGLKALIRNVHGAAPGALDALVGTSLIAPATTGPGAAGPATDAEGETLPTPKQAPPGPPPDAGGAPSAKAPPGQAAAVARMRRGVQARQMHHARFLSDGQWALFHPPVCKGNAYACPHTFAVMRKAPAAVPGTPGTYRVLLDAFGRVQVGASDPFVDLSVMVPTLLTPARQVDRV
jgi:hypothetical protein